jgi:hypothetical protein
MAKNTAPAPAQALPAASTGEEAAESVATETTAADGDTTHDPVGSDPDAGVVETGAAEVETNDAAPDEEEGDEEDGEEAGKDDLPEYWGDIVDFVEDWFNDMPHEAASGSYGPSVRDRWAERLIDAPDGEHDIDGWFFTFASGRFTGARVKAVSAAADAAE